VGGIFSDEDDQGGGSLEGDSYAVDVKNKDNLVVLPKLKVNVLKYGTGGVSKHLTTRPEIVKFISARGSKALLEMQASQQSNLVS
jgi:hypothetical protein